MEAPPPFSQVPQAAPPPKRTPWGLVIALLGVGFVVMGGIVVFLGYSVVTRARAGPPARNGFGHPWVVQKINSSWSIYEFPEIPMQIKLPGKPRTTRFADAATAWSTVDSWIAYDWNGWGTNCTLTGTWLKHPEGYDIDNSIEYLKSGYESWAGKSFEGTIRPRTLGRLEGRELAMNYRRSGKDVSIRVFLWERDGGVFYLVSQFYRDNREKAEAEYNLTLRSIQYEKLEIPASFP